MSTCSFCSCVVRSTAELEQHVVEVHSNHPQFTVTCRVCCKTWKNYDSFRKHVLRKHQQTQFSNAEVSNFNDASLPHSAQLSSQSGDDYDHSGTASHAELAEQYEKQASAQAAFFLLKLQSIHGLSQSAINDVISGTNGLIKTCSDISREKLLACTVDSGTGLDSSTIEATVSAEMPMDVFASVNTRWRHLKYLEDSFSLLRPVPVTMGERVLVKSLSKSVVNVKAFGYVVPFIDNLKHLLSLPEVRHCVLSPVAVSQSSRRCLFDFEDGQYCHIDPIFRHNSLRILGYSDEIEVVNPIGAHTKKHKLTVFFWTLLNIAPKLRSKLSCIQLVAVAKSRDCKDFGVNLLLHDFVQGLKLLYEDGVDVIDAHGNVTRMKGGLVAFTGDTLASNAIGGFKLSVGFAHKLCRTCDITREDVSAGKVLFDDESLRRSEQEHRKRCDELTTVMTGESKRYWSRLYGISGRSVFLDLPGFSVTKCLLHDPMHLLYEGISMAEVKRLLRYCILDKKYFSLSYVNLSMADIGRHLRANCRPNEIDASRLKMADDRLNLTASQLQWFSHMLPLAVACKVPEDDARWMNFVRLLMIQQLCTSPVATAATVYSLRLLVARHNHFFQEAYPDVSTTPKMHYLVHLPSQIENFGPLRNQWCMRMEAKNSFFKRKKLRNVKNVPFTVANDHQIWMCHSQHDDIGKPTERYLQLPLVHDAGYFVTVQDYCYSSILPCDLQLQDGDELKVVAKVAINDVVYKPQDVIMTRDKCEVAGPEFSMVDDIVIFGDVVYLICHCCEVQYFDCHRNAYCVQKVSTFAAINPASLLVPWPVLCQPADTTNALYVSSLSCSDIELVP